MWSITGAVVAPHLPSHGFCANLDGVRRDLARVARLSTAIEKAHGLFFLYAGT
jgi:hypothetical protein